MSRTLSSSFARCYGLARVARVWKISRASVYRSRKETPPDTIARRPGPIGACSDAELADHIRRAWLRPPRALQIASNSASVHRLNGEASVPIHLHVLDEGATADLFAQLDPVLAGGTEMDAGVDPQVGVLLGSLREAAE